MREKEKLFLTIEFNKLLNFQGMVMELEQAPFGISQESSVDAKTSGW